MLDYADCVNTHCPWSGKPVEADSLTMFEGYVVGFCNPGCRDKFASDPESFPEAVSLFTRAIVEKKNLTEGLQE